VKTRNEIGLTNLGLKLEGVYNEIIQWAATTFGPSSERGPIGPLKHLEKEAKEAQESPFDESEYADCMILVMDCAHRAGIDLDDLIDSVIRKMEVNKSREWPDWKDSDQNEPIEHIREEQEFKIGSPAFYNGNKVVSASFYIRCPTCGNRCSIGSSANVHCPNCGHSWECR